MESVAGMAPPAIRFVPILTAAASRFSLRLTCNLVKSTARLARQRSRHAGRSCRVLREPLDGPSRELFVV